MERMGVNASGARRPRARATWAAVLLAAAGFLELALAVNPLTGFLGALTLGSYLFIYTPLKQRSHLSTVIGALPGVALCTFVVTFVVVYTSSYEVV